MCSHIIRLFIRVYVTVIERVQVRTSHTSLPRSKKAIVVRPSGWQGGRYTDIYRGESTLIPEHPMRNNWFATGKRAVGVTPGPEDLIKSTRPGTHIKLIFTYGKRTREKTSGRDAETPPHPYSPSIDYHQASYICCYIICINRVCGYAFILETVQRQKYI